MLSVVYVCYMFFFFKLNTAYELRISDWSSDVCSSDLLQPRLSRDVRNAVFLLAARLADEPGRRPHVHADRPAHRFRKAGGLRWSASSGARYRRSPRGGCATSAPTPVATEIGRAHV